MDDGLHDNGPRPILRRSFPCRAGCHHAQRGGPTGQTADFGRQMKITLNGESRTVDDGSTVNSLLLGLGLDPRKVAVERNREIVPKSQYAEVALAEGDVLEIVHFIGGGSHD